MEPRLYQPFTYKNKTYILIEISQGVYQGKVETLYFYRNSKNELKVKTQADFFKKFKDYHESRTTNSGTTETNC